MASISYFRCYLLMMPFFNWTGLERIGVVEPDLNWSAGFGVALFCKNKKEEGPAGASPVAAPMPKSVPR